LLLFSGHSSIVLYLFNFLRLRDTRTTTLIGMGIKRHKEVFQPLYINTYSIGGRGRGIFAIFEYFCNFLKLKIHENE